MGPGAKLQVTLGGSGTVIECYYFWRKAEAAGDRELLQMKWLSPF